MKKRLYILPVLFLASSSVFAEPSRVGTQGGGGTAGPSAMPTMIPPSSSPAPAGPQNDRDVPANTEQNNIPTNNPAPNILTNSTPMPGQFGKVNAIGTNGFPSGLGTNYPAAGTNLSNTVTNAPRHHHWWQWH